jgi:uncharacterized protein (DUF433 family)
MVYHSIAEGDAVKHELDFYGGCDPRDVPTYTIPMAARYLRMAVPTLRNWVNGYTYPTDHGVKRAPRVIVPPPHREGARIFLSFTNLIEAHVLSSIRRVHEVPLPKVRKSLNYIEDKFGTEHPLAREKFATDGVDLFVEKFGELINVSNTEQTQIREAIAQGIQRIDYDAGFARRLFPYIRRAHEVDADQPRVVVIDPRISFGRPVVSGSGVPITEIYERFNAGDSVEHLAKDFRLNREKVQEALRAAA